LVGNFSDKMNLIKKFKLKKEISFWKNLLYYLSVILLLIGIVNLFMLVPSPWKEKNDFCVNKGYWTWGTYDEKTNIITCCQRFSSKCVEFNYTKE